MKPTPLTLSEKHDIACEVSRSHYDLEDTIRGINAGAEVRDKQWEAMLKGEPVRYEGRWLDMSDLSEGWSEWRNIDPIDLPRWEGRVEKHPNGFELRPLYTHPPVQPVQEPVELIYALETVAGYFHDGPVRNQLITETCHATAEKLRKENNAQNEIADNDKVICPSCCHQFRAIPENVQRLMLDAGFEPPFTQPAQQNNLSKLKPTSQAKIQQWITDGTFVERAIGVIKEQEAEIMRLEKAQPAQHECQYAKDVSMPEYRCVGKCQYDNTELLRQALANLIGVTEHLNPCPATLQAAKEALNEQSN